MTRRKNSNRDKIEEHALDPTLGDGRGKVPEDKTSTKEVSNHKNALDPTLGHGRGNRPTKKGKGVKRGTRPAAESEQLGGPKSIKGQKVDL